MFKSVLNIPVIFNRLLIKGTFMQIEKALKNNRVRVPKVP